MRFEIRHRTTYRYDHDVAVALHVARLRPREVEHQRCWKHSIEVEPEPAASRERVDYFGNIARFLTVEGSHHTLTITACSDVEVVPPRIPQWNRTPPWEEVVRLCGGSLYNHDTAAAEFAFDSTHVRRRDSFISYALPSFTPNRPLLEAVADLNGRIFRDFSFDPRATTIMTPVEEVLTLRRGVCQDFAHLAIACLRSMGLPARYVSGYIESLPPPGQAKLIGADASHAWFSVWCPNHGWVDYDPTNHMIPTDRHVVLGWGMDFADVSPIRGVLVGTGNHTLEVAVDMIARPG